MYVPNDIDYFRITPISTSAITCMLATLTKCPSSDTDI